MMRIFHESSEALELTSTLLVIAAAFMAVLALVRSLRRAQALEQEAEGFRSLSIDRAAREAALAHEIRTPLALVRGAVELLAEETPGPLNPRQRKFVNSALTHTNQLSALSENLLAQASMEADLFDLDLRTTDLRGLLRRSVVELRQIHQATLLLDTRGVPLWLTLDRTLILQALFNLISNSVRHSGIDYPTITIRVSASDHEATVSVSDNGQGMSQLTRENLFTPYAVGDASTSGTGLGMSVTRQIIQLHGGKMFVDSVPRCGTTVYFTLPRKRME